MRSALGKLGLEMGDVIMKKFDYSLARERVKLATDIVKLATASVAFVTAVITLLSVAFNYSYRATFYDLISEVRAKASQELTYLKI